jgi:putative ABC transport system permease protein
MGWLSALLHKKANERKLDSELRFHIERQIEENLAAGMSPERARREAAMEFGGLEQIKERCREVRPGRWIEMTWQDLRFGARLLRRSPGFTTVGIATIALGVGANAAIFSFIDSVVIKPLPYPEPERIVRVYEVRPDHLRSNASAPILLDWQKRGPFQYLAGLTGNRATLTGVAEPVMINEMKVSAHFFDILGVKAAMGRTFVEGDDQPGKDHVAVLTHVLWKTQFAGEPDIVGKTIILDGAPNTVIGVLPDTPGLYNDGWVKILRPLAFAQSDLTRDYHAVECIGRLRPGVTMEQARTQMAAIAISIAHDFPKSNKGWGVLLQPLTKSYVRGETTKSLFILMAAVGMLLLIACANLANLTLARGVSREREVAIRAALGAGYGRLMRQFLTESLLLSFGGGMLGIGASYVGILAMKAAMPPNWLNPEADPTLDGRVVLFSLVLTFVTGVVFGLVPALRASRPDLSYSIKQGGSGASAGKSIQSLRSAFVVAEVALATILLGGAGLLIRSFFQSQLVDPGFNSTNVVTAWLPVSDQRFPNSGEFLDYIQAILERVGSVPGVKDVAFTSALPMEAWGYYLPIQVVGSKALDSSLRPTCFVKIVTPSYFRTLGMRLVKGRTLTEQDTKGSVPSIVINSTMARQFFPTTDPIGKRILDQEIVYAKNQLGPEISWEIVGVVADEKFGGLSQSNDDKPEYYVSIEQSPANTLLALVVRGDLRPESLEHSIAAAVHEVDHNQALDDMRTLDKIKDNSLGSDRLRSALITVFASMALILAAIGLYGVISYSVAQRTREIGIRVALGASPRKIAELVIQNALVLTLFGLVVGVAGAIGLARFLSSVLFEVSPYDPLALGTAVVILTVTALLACLIPVRRAIRLDPIIALRSE